MSIDRSNACQVIAFIIPKGRGCRYVYRRDLESRKQKLKEKSNFSRHFDNKKTRKWVEKAEDYGVCYLEISSAANQESWALSFQSQCLTLSRGI